MSRRQYHSIRIILLLIFLAWGLLDAYYKTTSPTPTSMFTRTLTDTPTAITLDTAIPSLVGTPLPLGFEPVTRNDDWTPHIEEFDGIAMALVPAGCFEMGSTDEQVKKAMRYCEELRGEGNCIRSWYLDEQPVETQCFDEPFWIDVYEVTNGQYGSSGYWSGDELPRESVNWADAVVHCENRGGGLPTEAEWEYAARGPDELVFPWGNVFKRELVNSCDSSCELNLIGTLVDDGYPHTAPVGSFPNGASWVGAMDTSGNVWEWTSTIHMDYPYSAADGREVDSNSDDSKRVLRGGAWFHTGKDLLRIAARYEISPDHFDFVTGFRCVIPSDTTLLPDSASQAP